MAILKDIRKAIAASGESRYRIAKETGLSQVHLCQFMQGKRNLSVPALERLAAHLGLEVIVRRKRRRKG